MRNYREFVIDTVREPLEAAAYCRQDDGDPGRAGLRPRQNKYAQQRLNSI